MPQHALESLLWKPPPPKMVPTNVRNPPPYTYIRTVSHCCFQPGFGTFAVLSVSARARVYLDSLVTHNNGLLSLQVVEHLRTAGYDYGLLAF